MLQKLEGNDDGIANDDSWELYFKYILRAPSVTLGLICGPGGFCVGGHGHQSQRLACLHSGVHHSGSADSVHDGFQQDRTSACGMGNGPSSEPHAEKLAVTP